MPLLWAAVGAHGQRRWPPQQGPTGAHPAPAPPRWRPGRKLQGGVAVLCRSRVWWV